MTRILFDAAAQDDGPSGTKTRLALLVPALRAAGHEVEVAGAATGRRTVAGRLLRPHALEAAAGRHAADAVVYETLPAPRLRTPAFFVVHDLRRLRAGGLRGVLARSWLAHAAGEARRIHAVSAAVAQELEAEITAARGKVDVVHNAVRIRAGAHAPLPAGVGPPFVIAVGHAEPRKNWPFVSVLAAALRPAGITLVRAGRGSAGVGAPDVVDLGVVGDDVRDALFAAAAAVVAPSTLEGFGLVPLEALACGAWVVASGIAAHREVLADGASYFAPGDCGAAAALVLEAVRAPSGARAARTEAALQRASVFTPERAAAAFLASLARGGVGQPGPAVRR